MKNQKIIVIFGLPGAGKTYVGKVLAANFGYFFYDGDGDLTDEMKEAIKTKTPFTDPMRDRFFARLIESVRRLSQQHVKLVVAQMFIKEKYRQMFLSAFPEAQFVLVTAEDAVREARLLQRTELPLDVEYSRQMVKNFEEPASDIPVIENDEEGDQQIILSINRVVPT